jgi:ATP:corrinoid adenosyltransferase
VSDGGCVRIYAGEAGTASGAAYGLAMLRRGDGRRVAVVRFLGPGVSGEVAFAEELGIDVFEFGAGRRPAGEGWRTALDLIVAERYDVLVFDGVLDAVKEGLVPVAEVEGLFERGPSLELVLTGRSSPVELVKRADVVVEMLDIKHQLHRDG